MVEMHQKESADFQRQIQSRDSEKILLLQENEQLKGLLRGAQEVKPVMTFRFLV